MKKAELTQIKGLDIKELRQKSIALRKEIADLVLDKNMKKLKDVKMVSKKKKELSQVLTMVRQKELLAQLEDQKKEIAMKPNLVEKPESEKGKEGLKLSKNKK